MTVSPSRAVFSWITTVSVPGGSTPPVKMRAASPAPTAPPNGPPGRDLADELQAHGRCGDVRGAHRVAVHGGNIGRRLRAQRREIRGEHAAVRPSASGTRLGRQRLARLRARARAPPRPGSSATGSRPRRAIVARFAAALFDQTNALDAHAALDRLHHVVDGEAGDRRRRSAPPSRRRSGL